MWKRLLALRLSKRIRRPEWHVCASSSFLCIFGKFRVNRSSFQQLSSRIYYLGVEKEFWDQIAITFAVMKTCYNTNQLWLHALRWHKFLKNILVYRNRYEYFEDWKSNNQNISSYFRTWWLGSVALWRWSEQVSWRHVVIKVVPAPRNLLKMSRFKYQSVNELLEICTDRDLSRIYCKCLVN